MYLDSLQYFVSVAELGSVSRAAQKMYTSQQVVSAHIQRLEKYYRAQLIYRTRPITLTRTGEILLRGARDVLSTLERTKERIEETRKEEPNRLVLSTGRTAAPPFTEKLLRAFQARMPDVELAMMHPTSTDTLWTTPPEGAHILIGEMPFEGDVFSVELFSDRYCLVGHRKVFAAAQIDPESEVLTMEQIRSLCATAPARLTDTLLPEQSRRLFEELYPGEDFYAAKKNVVCSTDFVKYLCRTGQCVTFLPAILAFLSFGEDGDVIRIPAPGLIPEKRMGLGINRDVAEAKSVKVFIQTAKELLAPPSHAE